MSLLFLLFLIYLRLGLQYCFGPLFISLTPAFFSSHSYSFIILPLVPFLSNEYYFVFYSKNQHLDNMLPFHSQYSSRTNYFSLIGILSSPHFSFLHLYSCLVSKHFIFTLLIFNNPNGSVKRL